MRTLTLAVALVACAIAAGGCGDDESDDGSSAGGGGSTERSSPYGGGGGEAKGGGGEEAGGGAATRLELSADPDGALAFDKASLQAKPGKVTIAFDNQSGVPHAVEVEGGGVEEETETFTEGSEELTLDLKAGEYRFYCPVGNHAQGGMEGTLTVR
jgi:plastocyanin